MKVLVFASLLAVSELAAAQPAMVGAVRAPSGTGLEGVTVEARSPALIVRTRTTHTDAEGRYRLDHLPPGIYDVRFTLAGWSPLERRGIALTGSVTATIDAQLVLGPHLETVTVVGDIPAVDVHTATREVTLTGATVSALPTVRSYNALVVLVPGVITNTNDVVTGTATTSFPMHGGRTNEGRLSLDGFTVGSPPSGNSAASYVVDVGAAQEVTFTTASALGESETAGLVMNIVPKSGGNTLHGSFYASGTRGAWQSDNLTPALRAQGLTAATPLSKVYDVSGTVGGPIRRDRAWYFANAHVGGSTKDSASVYYNRHAGDASAWLYAPDDSRRAYSDRTFENASARLTWQVARRHTISAFWDAQALCRTCTGATPGLSEPARISPEAVGVLGRPLHVSQVTWSSPVTSRLLLDAGFGGTFFGVGNFERVPNPTRDLIRVVEQCASGCAANGNIPGLAYRSQDFSDADAGSSLYKASASYVAGAHTLKVGYQHTRMTDDRTWMTNDENLTYRVNNGVPNQLTQSISPWVNNARVAWDGVYIQDQWSRDRLTLQGALRFDRARSWFPPQQEGPSRFLPTPIVFPRMTGVDSYKDLTPRVGLAYDLFDNGQTAIKVSLGKYLEGAGVSGTYANTNPTLRLPQTTTVFGTAGVTRAWTDANRNFVPDCDLHNPAAQDLRASGGDQCGVISNVNFGSNVLTNSFDPAMLDGWRIRPSDWHLSASVQRELAPGAAIDLTYTRRWYHGFVVADNLALQPSDLTPFAVVAPADPRLPGGGGYVLSGLYDVVPEKAGAVNNLITDAGRYGGWRQSFDGIDVSVTVRAGHRLTLVGGTSTGRTVADACGVRERLPELATTTTGTSAFGAGLVGSAVTPTSPYCDVSFGLLTQARGLAAYVVPKLDLQLSAVLQSKPGAMLAANYAAPNAAVAPSLGRNLSGQAANVTVNLVRPGSLYGDRVNQLDVRIAKRLTYRRSRTLLAADVYNLLNSSAVLTYDSTYVPGGPWLQPLSILTPRVLRFTAEIAF